MHFQARIKFQKASCDMRYAVGSLSKNDLREAVRKGACSFTSNRKRTRCIFKRGLSFRRPRATCGTRYAVGSLSKNDLREAVRKGACSFTSNRKRTRSVSRQDTSPLCGKQNYPSHHGRDNIPQTWPPS
jgi:hypothetical protein